MKWSLLKINVERITPEQASEDTLKEHRERYIYASKFVKNMKVLDVACGVGYGSQILLDMGAKECIGVDYSIKAIEYAKSHYKGKFYVMDATNLRFPNKSFDAVVSFETLEHIKDYLTYFKELKRVLKPNGIIILSCPVYHGIYIIDSKWHVTKFTEDEILKIFRSFFNIEKISAQTRHFISFPGRGIIEKIFKIKRDYRIYKHGLFRPMNLIIVGKNNRL